MLTYFYAPFSLLLKFVYVTSAAYFYGIFFVYFSVVFSLISVVTDMNAFLRSEHLEAAVTNYKKAAKNFENFVEGVDKTK